MNFNTLCGKCLHNKLAHTEHNGHFMYCASCKSICELTEFNQELKPTSLEIIYQIQSAREYNEYIPREVKEK